VEEKKKDAEEEKEEGEEKKKVPEKSDVRKRLYALFCVGFGTAEYLFSMIISTIILLFLTQTLFVITGPAFASIRTFLNSILIHVLSLLWIRWRYAKREASVPSTKGCWNIVIPCIFLVVVLDLGLTIFLYFIDDFVHADLVKPNVIINIDLAKVFVQGIVAPLCEEYVFRWALLVEARKLKGTSAEIPVSLQGAASGIAFGLIHISSAVTAGESPLIVVSHILYAASFGAAMTYLDTAAGNRMWPSILCHVINNLSALFLPTNYATEDMKGILIIAAGALVQCAALIGMTFIPVRVPVEPEKKEHAN